MQDEKYTEAINFIKKQFLCNVPIKEICWQNFCIDNIDIQEKIIKNTVASDNVIQFPINLNYQKLFLKSLLGYLEGEKSEIHESLYKEYTRLVALSDSGINFKHYCFKDESKSIILKEDTNLISEGTTGLRTWQASLVLSEWILANRCHFFSKIILELGSGTGLTGLVLLLKCKPDAVYLTDCHPSVLKALCDNVSLNLKSKGKTYCEDKLLLKESINSSIVKVFDIPWEDLSADFCQKLGHIDILVAADVVYDKTIFNPLNNAVNCLFENCAIEEFILACTERNSETLEEFLGLLRKNYIICDVKVPYQENFLWPRDAPIKIFKITRSK